MGRDGGRVGGRAAGSAAAPAPHTHFQPCTRHAQPHSPVCVQLQLPHHLLQRLPNAAHIRNRASPTLDILPAPHLYVVSFFSSRITCCSCPLTHPTSATMLCNPLPCPSLVCGQLLQLPHHLLQLGVRARRVHNLGQPAGGPALCCRRRSVLRPSFLHRSKGAGQSVGGESRPGTCRQSFEVFLCMLGPQWKQGPAAAAMALVAAAKQGSSELRCLPKACPSLSFPGSPAGLAPGCSSAAAAAPAPLVLPPAKVLKSL